MFGRKKKTVEAKYGYNPKQESLKPKFIKKIDEYLHEDEQVDYGMNLGKVTTGSRGHLDEVEYQSTKGIARFAVTNERLIGILKKFTGMDIVEVDLDKIKHVDTKSTAMWQRVIVHTEDPSYDFHVAKIPERKEMVNYLKELADANQSLSNDTESTASAAEKLRELNNLKEDGLITDEEYDVSRRKLIERL